MIVDTERDYVTLEQIADAAQQLAGIAVKTPLLEWDTTTWLKPECLQPTGSFKIRGAYTKLSRIPAEDRKRGVVAYSSGNHAQAVAWAAHMLGMDAVLVLPEDAPAKKRKGVVSAGGRVITCGVGSAERRKLAEDMAAESGRLLVPPYDDLDIISGQGTIGLELIDALPGITSVLVPVGGGGLSSGIATAIKLRSPKTRVIGVEPEVAADARESLRAGRIVAYSAARTGHTIADGVRTQSLGVKTFAHLSRYLDDIVTVAEQDIVAATAALATRKGLVVEPSGALPLAAHLSGVAGSDGRRALVLSGGNLDMTTLSQILEETRDHPWVTGEQS